MKPEYGDIVLDTTSNKMGTIMYVSTCFWCIIQYAYYDNILNSTMAVPNNKLIFITKSKEALTELERLIFKMEES
jgi:hypothetical protein